MKLLSDGSQVFAHRVPVVGVWTDHLYVEEADRSCGIRVIFGPYTPSPDLVRGNLASIQGRIATVENECVLLADSPIECDNYEENGPVSPVGVSSMAIMGWPLPPRTETAPRVIGLLPLGVYIRIWGRVTATGLADDEGYFIYLDDGWGLTDKSGINATGIRVYSNARPALGGYLVATGVLANKAVYDPTPYGTTGDELIVPVLRCSHDEDPYFRTATGTEALPAGSVSGRVRLVGQPAPGDCVRIYCQNGSVVINQVTDTFVSYTVGGVTSQGCPVSASSPGYTSNTRIARSGDTNVDFELRLAERSVEIASDRSSVPICSGESALISVFARDSEGKPIHNSTVRLNTTRGTFSENGAKELIAATNEQGVSEAHLGGGTDGPGMAAVTASLCSSPATYSSVDIQFKGPDVAVSADPKYVQQGGTSTITAMLSNVAGPMTNTNITLRTDSGTFVQTGTAVYQSVTDGQGSITATLQMSSQGTAKVLATHLDGCSHSASNWTFVACRTDPWFSGGFGGSNPLIVDLDKQDGGKKEVVLQTLDGQLLALSSTGSLIWSQQTHSAGGNSAGCVTLDPGPSAKPCIFVPSELQPKVCGFSHDGKPLAGWPAHTNFRFLSMAASIGDVNLDGSPEILCGDESCYVFSWNPTGDWKKNNNWNSSFLWRNLTGSGGITIANSTCALGDLDGDPGGIPDVVMGSNDVVPVYSFPGDLWGDFGTFGIYTPGYPKATLLPAQSSPAIGDIDGDGRNDMTIGSNDGGLYIWLSTDNSWKSYATGGPVKSSPALYDIDDDGRLDIIVGSNSGKLFAFNWKGQAPEGWTDGITLNSGGSHGIQSSPVIGDINGDGVPEIVVGCDDGNIYAVYKNGFSHVENGASTGPIAWIRCCAPTSIPSAQVLSTPVIDDINADGKVDVIAAGTHGVYVFHFDAPYTADPVKFPWPTFHRDNQRTGCATAPPAPTSASIQGYVRKNGVAVLDAKVYITFNDDSAVYVPHSDPPAARSYVITAGVSDTEQGRKGAYSINQLPPNSTYKLTVEVTGEPNKVVSGVAVTTGLVHVDVDL